MRCFLASCMASACHESILDVAVANAEGSRAVDVPDNVTSRVDLPPAPDIFRDFGIIELQSHLR